MINIKHVTFQRQVQTARSWLLPASMGILSVIKYHWMWYILIKNIHRKDKQIKLNHHQQLEFGCIPHMSIKLIEQLDQFTQIFSFVCYWRVQCITEMALKQTLRYEQCSTETEAGNGARLLPSLATVGFRPIF